MAPLENYYEKLNVWSLINRMLFLNLNIKLTTSIVEVAISNRLSDLKKIRHNKSVDKKLKKTNTTLLK